MDSWPRGQVSGVANGQGREQELGKADLGDLVGSRQCSALVFGTVAFLRAACNLLGF